MYIEADNNKNLLINYKYQRLSRLIDEPAQAL